MASLPGFRKQSALVVSVQRIRSNALESMIVN